MTIKKDPKSYVLTSGDPQTCPREKCLHYYILHFIAFDLICNMTMFVQNGFWTPRGHTRWPCSRGYIKIPNVFLQSSTIGLLPVTVSRFLLKKPKRSCVTIKRRTQNPTFWPLVTPDMLEVNVLHHYNQFFITFDLICNITMFVQNGFWTLRGHTPLALPQGVTSKF